MAEGDTTTATTGAGETGTGTTATGGGGTSWTASLPEAIRGNEAWKDVPDVGTLANRYLDTRKPFAEQLPEKIRGEAAFKDIKSLDSLADSYFNAQKMLGVPRDQILRLPSNPDDPKEMDPIYNRLGRPEKAADYKITLPEGIVIADEIRKSLTERAHGLGYTNKQLDGMYGWMMELNAKGIAAQEAASNADLAKAAGALKTEWGAAFEQKIGDSIATVEFLETKYPGLKSDLDATKLGNNPALAKFLVDYAQTLKEDGKLVGRGTGGGNILSPAEALQSINALNSDPVFTKAYFNKSDSGHKAAVEKREALYKLAYPEPQRQAG